MTIDEAIAELEAVRAVHGGHLPVLWHFKGNPMDRRPVALKFRNAATMHVEVVLVRQSLFYHGP